MNQSIEFSHESDWFGPEVKCDPLCEFIYSDFREGHKCFTEKLKRKIINYYWIKLQFLIQNYQMISETLEYREHFYVLY